ncbi:MAG: hypothetical protein ACXWCG_03240 [Flavitalea sp.]
MKTTLLRKLALYLYNKFLGNFLGFIIGIASTKLVAHYFATRSIRNLWGLTTRKTLLDKQTFSILEWSISIVIGFIVFEIISKGLKKKMEVQMPSVKMMVKSWYRKSQLFNQPAHIKNYSEKDAATAQTRSTRVWRDVQ